MDTLTIRKPDDFHVHLRDGTLLEKVLPQTARQFARALVMPNLRPRPVCTAADAAQYSFRIGRAMHALALKGFTPLGAIQLTGETSPGIIAEAAESGVIAGKLYPAGVTTNSDNGVADIEALWPVFRAMETRGMTLCLHGEHPDPKYDDIDRETAFMPVLHRIARDFPGLKIVLEHVSHRAGIAAVMKLDNVAATVTPHHLVLTMDDVFGPMFRPHNFCKPTAKRKKDRDAILDVVLNGHPKFFLGTDSAPHLRPHKEHAECAAGVFSAPAALPLLAAIFDEHGALDRIEDFVSHSGARWYGLPLNKGTLTLTREPWCVPREIGGRLGQCPGIVPFMAGETLPWCVAD